MKALVLNLVQAILQLVGPIPPRRPIPVRVVARRRTIRRPSL
jgi:hypothetical protein